MLTSFLDGGKFHRIEFELTDLVYSMIEMLYTDGMNQVFTWFISSRDLPSQVHNFIRTRDCIFDSYPSPSVEATFSRDLDLSDLYIIGTVRWQLPEIDICAPPSLRPGEEYRISCRYQEPLLDDCLNLFPADPEFIVSSEHVPLAWDSNKRCFRAMLPAAKRPEGAEEQYRELLERTTGQSHTEPLKTKFMAKIVRKFTANVTFQVVTRYIIDLEVERAQPYPDHQRTMDATGFMAIAPGTDFAAHVSSDSEKEGPSFPDSPNILRSSGETTPHRGEPPIGLTSNAAQSYAPNVEKPPSTKAAHTHDASADITQSTRREQAGSRSPPDRETPCSTTSDCPHVFPSVPRSPTATHASPIRSFGADVCNQSWACASKRPARNESDMDQTSPRLYLKRQKTKDDSPVPTNTSRDITDNCQNDDSTIRSRIAKTNTGESGSAVADNPTVSDRSRRSQSLSPDEDKLLRYWGQWGIGRMINETNSQHGDVPFERGPWSVLVAQRTSSWSFSNIPDGGYSGQEGTMSPTELQMQEIRRNYEEFLKRKNDKENEDPDAEGETDISEESLCVGSSEGNSTSESSSSIKREKD